MTNNNRFESNIINQFVMKLTYELDFNNINYEIFKQTFIDLILNYNSKTLCKSLF